MRRATRLKKRKAPAFDSGITFMERAQVNREALVAGVMRDSYYPIHSHLL